MINFRYHIVSLMAVFLALAVGIGVGVSLSPSVSAGLNEQAAQDRKQVTALRTELDRVNALDQYREAWAERTGQQVAASALNGVAVALVSMPDAPNDVVQALTEAVQQAGGTVVRTVEVDDSVYDATQVEQVDAALAPFAEQVGLDDAMSPATRFGRVLSWSIAAKTPQAHDDRAAAIAEALQQAGLARFGTNSDRQAELVVVVTAAAAGTRSPHRRSCRGTCRPTSGSSSTPAGWWSPDPTATTSPAPTSWPCAPTPTPPTCSARWTWRTCPAASLTTVLAGQEQLLGRQGHYGALTRADAPLPTLPVR